MVGEKDSFTQYFDDRSLNHEYYLLQVKKLFEEREVKNSEIIKLREQRERVEEFENNPPPRPKYDPKIHKFIHKK